jgi:hypothetical protein
MRVIILADTPEEEALFLETNTSHPLVFENIQDFALLGWQIYEGQYRSCRHFHGDLMRVLGQCAEGQACLMLRMRDGGP